MDRATTDHVCCPGCGCAAMDGERAGGSRGTVDDFTGILAYRDAPTARWNADTALGTAAVVTYSILDPTDLPSARSLPYPGARAHAFNDAQAANFRKAVAHIEATAGVVLVEVGSGETAMFDAFRVTGSGFGGYANYPYVTDTFSATGGAVTVENGSATFAPGSFAYHTILHELGHALGLQHSFDGPNVLAEAVDDWRSTVMSYTQIGPTPKALRPLDVEALRHLYGGPIDTSGWTLRYDASEDVLHVASTRASEAYVLPSTAAHANGRGGADAITGRQHDDVLLGGVGRDTLDGNLGDDTLRGGGGDDHLWGMDGTDVLRGGGGNDVLEGGVRDDTLMGGAGDDTLDGGTQSDRLRGGGGLDVLLGGTGSDRLGGGGGADLLIGGDGGDAMAGGGGADVLKGGGGNDDLRGGAGDDTLRGGEGEDTLRGDAGDDFLFGDLGRDLYVLGNGADTVRHTGGSDTVEGFADGAHELWLDRGALGLAGDVTATDLLAASRIGAHGLLIELGADDLTLRGVADATGLEDRILLV